MVVDDEESLVESLRFLLEQQQYRVLCATSGSECLQQVQRQTPDLILLDVMLPGTDGFEVCRQLRTQGYAGLVLLLTARGDEIDQVLGLELGADDYIKAHLRRARRAPDNTLRAGELQLCPERREASLREQRLELSPKEFQLLQFLWENRRRAQSRERILESVWGYDFDGESRVVNVTIQRLREKIEDDPAAPRYIVTVRGVGYMFDV
jgi:DNA-binding response OmpR family regulator